MMNFLSLQFIKSSLWIREAHAQAGGGSQGGGVSITNPLGVTTIADLLDRIIGYLIIIGAPVSAIMVLIGGFQILTSSGDPEKFKTGRNTILYAAIGYGIVIIAKGVSLLIKQLFGVGT